MYSNFGWEDIRVEDWKGLKEFLKMWKEINPTSWINCKKIEMIYTGKESGKEYFTFCNWDDMKLISYWYDLDLLFLNCVAKYISGEVEWNFENKDETGFINFENGECKITTGVMNYEEWKPTIVLRDDRHNREPLSEKNKRLLTLSEL